MPTVLLITPYFPPMSVVGAKRPLNLVRHLPHFGWQPVVLAGDPAGENVDLGLADLIPADLPVSYAYGEGKQASTESAPRPREKERGFLGWDAGYITPFDRYLWHNGAALREATHLIEKHRPSAVVVCADPWSPLLVGVKLAHSPGLPLVVDSGIPGPSSEPVALRPPPTRWIIRQTEYRVFRTARRIVLNTEECHRRVLRRVPGPRPVGALHLHPERFRSRSLQGDSGSAKRSVYRTPLRALRRLVPVGRAAQGLRQVRTARRTECGQGGAGAGGDSARK